LGPERFLREIEIAAQLSHPHILPLYDSGEASGLLFYVMPYVGGASLGERLHRDGRLPLEEALHITVEVADALDYAHGRGVVHRDIKPGNILLESGHALVTDFGIARAISVAGEERVTLPGIAVGTPAYMSPEQAEGDHGLDARTDIYALGCVLYEMLTGEPPYSGSDPQAILAQKVTQSVPSLQKLQESVSRTLEHAIRRALAREPQDRFATSEEFAQALTSGAARWSPAAGVSTQRQEASKPRSIAVLPFANMSADPENEYFSDGIAEEITNALSKVHALHVVSRTSAFAFKGKDQDVRRIGEALGVAVILEGSVRRAGNRLRITAQLVSVADGYHLWSERYDRDAEDVFAIQDEIATKIAEALHLVLSEEERRELAHAPTDNVQAYEAYLRGRFFLHRFQKASVRHAKGMFEQAIGIDPEYALAFSGIADCCSFLYMYFDGSDENLEEADTASQRALELGPDFAEAHASRGLAVALSKRYEEAEAEFQKAIALNPSLFEAYYFYARTCFQQGKLEPAVELFEKACEVHEDYQACLLAALSYAGLGREGEAKAAYARALRVIEKHLELNPGDARALTLGAGCMARLGRTDEAVLWCERSLHIDAEDPVVVYAVACVYAILQMADKALDGLEKAIETGFGNKKWIENDPDFASLRDHPRFQELVRE
jgi:TolB-like protein/Flp pilus assembly protein TadD